MSDSRSWAADEEERTRAVVVAIGGYCYCRVNYQGQAVGECDRSDYSCKEAGKCLYSSHLKRGSASAATSVADSNPNTCREVPSLSDMIIGPGPIIPSTPEPPAFESCADCWTSDCLSQGCCEKTLGPPQPAEAPVYEADALIDELPISEAGRKVAQMPSSNPGATWIRDAKKFEGKPQAAQVIQGFALALQAVIEVSTFGFGKHTAPAREKLIREEGATPEQAAQAISFNNWQNGTIETYDDAKMRHIIARMLGEERASDSGLKHRAHEAWNALAALTLEIMNDPL